MYNLHWGGIDPNHIRTVEFLDFSQKVGAQPLICVNFESEGRKDVLLDPDGKSRLGSAEEAAEWVDYCNNPSNRLRIEHGFNKPFNVPFWQIGNETSRSYVHGFDRDTAIKKTIEFAKTMRSVDPSIKLIGWGEDDWAKPMIDEAGEYLNYIAFHHMFNPDEGLENSPLRGIEYRKDFART